MDIEIKNINQLCDFIDNPKNSSKIIEVVIKETLGVIVLNTGRNDLSEKCREHYKNWGNKTERPLFLDLNINCIED